jgi:PAS domain S-box-containing protein
LLDRSLSVLVRFPDPASNGKPIDRKVVFPALFERILRSHISATFTAISPIDDVERIFSYQTLSHYLQYYIVSGLSPMDYLAGWHSEVFKMSLFAAGFCISTLIFAWLLHLGWMKTRRSEIAAERSLRALNESLEDMVQERTQSAENANKILQAVIDCMSDWVWEIDNERRYTYCSPQVIKSMGYSPVDMIGKTPFDFMIDDEAQRIKSAFEDAFRQQSLIRGLERRCIAKAGNAVLFITNAVPILDENGCVTGYRGVETDLTDHRHAENAVRQQREFLETLMETIPNPIFYKDIDGRYTGCNRAFETFSGRPRQEIIGKTVYDLGPKELADKYFQKDRELYDHPGQQQYEWLFQRKDGEIRNVIFDEATLLDRNGHLQGLIGVISDITERKQAEKALIESESKYRQLFEVESDALFLIEADTLKILDVNPSAEKMYGYSREEFLTMRSVDVSAETNETSRAVREKLDRVPIRWHRKKDGTVFPVEISGTFFVLGDKSVHLPAIRDISLRMQAEAERLQLEQQLQQAKKAESLSTMAGAIAHNFNNILAAVIGNLEIAADEASQGSELHECITEALSSSLRAAELTRIMLTYLGHTDGKQKPVDVADAVREAISVIGPSIQRNIHLNTDIPSHGPTITADNILFVQILTNVLSNAVEAIGTQKGEITLIIDTLPQTTLQNEMFFPPGWQPNHQAYVCIVIADTGPGIVPENIEKIFDPFFSTKFLGRGLGLSMVAGLIRSMDGGISVISKPGWGTSFKLFFPITKHPNEK